MKVTTFRCIVLAHKLGAHYLRQMTHMSLLGRVPCYWALGQMRRVDICRRQLMAMRFWLNPT